MYNVQIIELGTSFGVREFRGKRGNAAPLFKYSYLQLLPSTKSATAFSVSS